jgi:ribosomal protein S8
MRGRPKEIIQEPKPTKFIRIYEDDEMVETWKFDLKKTTNGPIEVDIKYKAGAEKAIKQRAKDAKQQKRTERQMKKINEAQAAKRKK